MDQLILIFTCIYVFFLILFPSGFNIKKFNINSYSILTIVIILFFIKIMYTFFKSNKRKQLKFLIKIILKDYMNLSLISFFLLIIISIVFSYNKNTAFQNSIGFSYYVALYFVIKYSNWDNKSTNIFSIVLITLCGIACIIGIIQFLNIGISSQNIVRIESTLENSNVYSAFLILFIFPTIMLSIHEKNKKKKGIYIILSALIFINIILTFSRNAFLGLFLGAILIIIMYDKKFIYILNPIVILLYLSPNVRLRIKQILDYSQNCSRIKIWATTIDIIKNYPILGIGYGNFINLYPKYAKKYSYISNYNIEKLYHPHNMFLKIQCELGILGTIIFINLIFCILYSLRKYLNNCNKDKFQYIFYKGFFISLIVFFFMNIVDCFFMSPSVVFIFWIFIGMFEHLRCFNKN